MRAVQRRRRRAEQAAIPLDLVRGIVPPARWQTPPPGCVRAAHVIPDRPFRAIIAVPEHRARAAQSWIERHVSMHDVAADRGPNLRPRSSGEWIWRAITDALKLGACCVTVVDDAVAAVSSSSQLRPSGERRRELLAEQRGDVPPGGARLSSTVRGWSSGRSARRIPLAFALT